MPGPISPSLRPLAVAAVLIAVVGACGAPAAPSAAPAAVPTTVLAATNQVPTYRGDAARTGVMPGPGPAGTPIVAWEFQAKGSFGNSPVAADGIVYATAGDGMVHAIDLASGKERWSASVDGDVSATPVIAGGLVVVADEAGTLHALERADGSVAWQTPTDGAITGSPAAYGDDLITATDAGTMYQIDASSGDVVLTLDVGGPTRRSIAVSGDTAYLGILGELVAVDLEVGEVRWDAPVAKSGNVGTPTAADGIVYAATGLDGELPDLGIAAVDAATGEVLWRYASPEQAQIYTPAISNGTAYVIGHDRLFVALDAKTGRSVWSIDLGAEFEALPSVVGDLVFTVGNDGPAVAVDTATKRVAWSVPLKGIPFAPTVVDGMLLVGTDRGTLYAIGGS